MSKVVFIETGLRRRAGLGREIYPEDRVEEYQRMWQAVADAIGGDFVELDAQLWQIEVDGRHARILNHQLDFDSPVTLELAGRKPVTHRLLMDAGLPVPEHLVFSLETLEKAQDFVAAHEGDYVIKPAGGYGGKGVTTNVETLPDVRGAAILASSYGEELLIERMVFGESYRLLVLEGEVIDAVYRRGLRLVGDGVSTVGELIDAESARREAAGIAAISVDRDCHFTLKSQGLSAESRPPEGHSFLAKTIGATTSGAEVRTVYTDSAMDQICDSIRRDAELASRIIGSDFLGVDVITSDPTLPLAASGGVINEVNTTPALHHHYHPEREKYPAAAVAAIVALLRRDSAVVSANRG